MFFYIILRTYLETILFDEITSFIDKSGIKVTYLVQKISFEGHRAQMNYKDVLPLQSYS